MFSVALRKYFFNFKAKNCFQKNKCFVTYLWSAFTRKKCLKKGFQEMLESLDFGFIYKNIFLKSISNTGHALNVFPSHTMCSYDKP